MNKLLTKATALYKQGRYQAAMTIAKKVVVIEKSNDTALFYVAHGLYYAGHFRRSIQYWKRLERITPRDPVIHLNMGACYDDLGEFSLAVENYKKALELDPACGKALYNLGALYYKTRRYRLAAEYLGRCYSQKYEIKACFTRLAHSYFKTGQPQKEQLKGGCWRTRMTPGP
jgi:tetratricopeptide (TPR) repeat protein